MFNLKQNFKVCVVFTALISLSACNTLKHTDSLSSQRLNDPVQGLNKRIYAFNMAADKAVLRPTAKVYHAVLPDSAERAISRFFNNIGEPLNIVNNLLQGNIDGALNSTYRFSVNTTVGLLGFFDVANAYNVDEKNEDFGQTLAVWGVKPGPYIMLPFLGPTNVRDLAGRLTDNAALYPINEITHSRRGRLGLSVLDIVDTRVGLLGLDATLDNQLDSYLFLKDAYESRRIISVYNGNPPEADEDEFDF